MSSNKSAKTPTKLASPEKSTVAAAAAVNTIKHSAPFYISPKLFRNKRLKLKRCKWAAARARENTTICSTKTDRRKQNLSILKADVTIDLLSDDDVEPSFAISRSIRNNGNYSTPPQQQQQFLGNFPQQTIHAQKHIELLQLEKQQKLVLQQQEFTQNHLQHFYVYPGGPLELSKVPNITLIPVQPLATQASFATQKNPTRRKRKSRPPKRHAEPTIVNNESIVLTDDSDVEATATHFTKPFQKPNNFNIPPVQLGTIGNELTLTPSFSANALKVNSTKSLTAKPASVGNRGKFTHEKNNAVQSQVGGAPGKCTSTTTSHTAQFPKVNNFERTTAIYTLTSPPPLAPLHIIPPTHTAQVDDEVTVSIVPRSSTAGSCSKPTTNELFPMLPDETTVHTVIANRIYELSLTKLREGLASCGIGEFAEGQPKVSPTRRKAMKTNPPPAVVMSQQQQQQPVSLKLSSDLSISLISDDEDEQQQQQQQLSAQKLLQQQPQLSIQHVQLPVQPVVTAADGRQLPRRRKLG